MAGGNFTSHLSLLSPDLSLIILTVALLTLVASPIKDIA